MKKFAYFMATVVGLFSSLFAGTARAECAEGDDTCGTNCCYHISEEESVGIVYAGVEGEDAVYENDVFGSGCNYDKGSCNISVITFSEGITKISSDVSGYGSTSKLYLPNSLKEVGSYPFNSIPVLIFPDNIDTSGWSNDAFLYYGDYNNIACVGDLDTCKEKVANFTCRTEWDYDVGEEVSISCAEYVQLASEEYCTGVNYHWNNGKCEYIGGSAYNDIGEDEEHINCGEGKLEKDGICVSAAQGCGEGYRQFENWCNKVRWTPAEAAEKLTDDNNNSVTITFKK